MRKTLSFMGSDSIIAQQHKTVTSFLTHDACIVIIARALRTFGYGFSCVILGVMLTDAGLSPLNIGILLAIAALGDIAFSLMIGLFADRLGRKRLLVTSALLMVMTGLIFALTHNYFLLLLAAFCGTISPSTNDNTPFSAVEQSILAQTCHAEQHTTLFAIYNFTAQLAGAVGGLVVGFSSLLTSSGISADMGNRLFFALYGVLACITALLFLQLSPAAELQQSPKMLRKITGKRPALQNSRTKKPKKHRYRVRSLVLKLSCLFAVDAFAGGLAVQTILAIWFHQRFGASLQLLGFLFSALNILSALSLLSAPYLTKRFGLLRTMLIPHFISNLLLLLVPILPTLPLSALCLLGRQSLSKIDVPARQAFTITLVSPEERTAATSFTTTARSIAVSVSPLLSGFLLSGPFLVLGLPILLSSSIAFLYEASMWKIFSKVSPSQDTPLKRNFKQQQNQMPFPSTPAISHPLRFPAASAHQARYEELTIEKTPVPQEAVSRRSATFKIPVLKRL